MAGQVRKSTKTTKTNKEAPVKDIEPEFFEDGSVGEEFEGFGSTSESESEEDDAGSDEEVQVAANSDNEESEATNVGENAKDKTRANIGELAKKAIAAADKKGSQAGPENSKVVYVGRIPHGFYEDQMRDYFGQFGTITRLRLSRNKQSGASKHYAFIEFADPEVAAVVCETMDNYLLFGHILKVKLMETENLHEKLFVGANRKYQAIPWGKVMKQRYERKHSREWWEERAAKEQELRKERAKKLKAIGIDYKF